MDFTREPSTFEPPTLHHLPQARSRFGLPESHDLAHATFGSAQKDHEDGKFAAAATKFMSVAAILKAPNPETPYSDQYTQMRMVAYKNAALSFGAARDLSGAKTALTRALKDDPGNKAGLEALLLRF